MRASQNIRAICLCAESSSGCKRLNAVEDGTEHRGASFCSSCDVFLSTHIRHHSSMSQDISSVCVLVVLLTHLSQ